MRESMSTRMINYIFVDDRVLKDTYTDINLKNLFNKIKTEIK